MIRVPLIKKRKKLARALLYGSAVAIPLIVWIVAGHLSTPMQLDVSWDLPAEEYEAIEAVQLLQAYLRIDTSAPDGNEIPGAEFLAHHLRAAGIETHIERIGPRNANLWAVIDGEDPKAVVLHNHIDVEPILHPDAWTRPPFGGELKVPWIIGRGAFDMKSVTIAQLLAMIELVRQDVPLKRSVMFLATGDEETGSRLGTEWVLREHPELVARMGVALTEGGVVEMREHGDIKFWGTETAQKRYIEVIACHPRLDRLEMLHDEIRRWDRSSFTRYRDPGTDRLLERYGPTRDHPGLVNLMADRDAMFSDAGFNMLPIYIQLMFRNDVAAEPPEPDPEGDGYRMRIVLALMPGLRLESARDELLPPWLTHGVSLSFVEPRLSPSSSHDHPVFRALDRFMQDESGGVHGPYFVGASATDARLFRAAGIDAFGYSPFTLMTTDTFQMKSANERIALPAFIEGVDRYVRLVRALVSE